MLENLRLMNISSQLARVDQVLQKKEELVQEKSVKSKEVPYVICHKLVPKCGIGEAKL